MSFEIWQGLVLIVVGAISGFLNVMAGGGSLLTVPVMVFMGMPGPVANGTNRIAILAQNIAAITAFFKKGFSDFKLSLSLAVCTLPGALIGAYIGSRLEGVWFNRILAIIMLGVMLVMFFDKGKKAQREKVELTRKRLVFGHLAMIGVGFYGGFIQVGVGFVLMPILYRILGLDLVRVNMHKVFIIGVYTVVALCVFAIRVEILWLLGGCLALGNMAGGWVGAHVSVSRGETAIKVVLNSILIIFIIKLLFFQSV